MSSPPNKYRPNIEFHEKETLGAHLNSLWNTLTIGVAYIDTQGNWVKVNPALCEILEYTEAELRQRTWQQLTHPDDLADDLEMLNQLSKGGINYYMMSKRYITKSGKVIWVKLKVSELVDDNQTVFYLSQVSPIIILEDPNKEKIEVLMQKLLNNGVDHWFWALVHKHVRSIFWGLLCSIVTIITLGINIGLEYNAHMNQANDMLSQIEVLNAKILSLESKLP